MQYNQYMGGALHLLLIGLWEPTVPVLRILKRYCFFLNDFGFGVLDENREDCFRVGVGRRFRIELMRREVVAVLCLAD